MDIKDFPRYPKVRRWDHVAPAKPNPVLILGNDGAIKVVKSDTVWIPLEDGLEIQFEKRDPAPLAQYHTGDYWLIPARVSLPPPGQIEYPNNQDYSPTTFLEPHGVQHHYAPLAYWDGTKLNSLRHTFGTL